MIREHLRTVVVDGFTDDQIITYLTNLYDGDEAAARWRHEALANLQDLLGLSANPRILSFIAALPEDRLAQVREQHGKISAADLYGELIGFWLGYETGRLRQRSGIAPLDDHHRFTAVTSVATRLWATDVVHAENYVHTGQAACDGTGVGGHVRG